MEIIKVQYGGLRIGGPQPSSGKLRDETRHEAKFQANSFRESSEFFRSKKKREKSYIENIMDLQLSHRLVKVYLF